MSVFIVESKLPAFTEEMMMLIPKHRLFVEKLFNKGILKMYAVSEDRSKWWCAVEAESENEVMDILAKMPIIKFLKPEINSLMFFDESVRALPGYSLN